MLDGTTHRDRIIRAAMHLCETRGWRDLSLGEIAGEAGIPLAELRNSFQSKAQILAAFSRAVDQAVLEKFPAPGPDTARDRLFDVILTRFEVMQPYKGALRRIRDDLGAESGGCLVAGAPRIEVAILDARSGGDKRRRRPWACAGSGVARGLFRDPSHMAQ